MPFTINTHDAWGTVQVGAFQTLEGAREVFSSLCRDPWYRLDGGIRALELVAHSHGETERLEWFAF